MAETDGSLQMKPSHEPIAKPSAPPVDETVAEWKQDPEFSSLPASRQAKIATNYFRQEYGGPEFEALPQDRQSRIIQNFLSVNLGDTGSVRMPVDKTVRKPVGPSKSPMDQQLAVKRANEQIGPDTVPSPEPRPTESQFPASTSAMIGPEARRREDAQYFRNQNLNPAVAEAGAVAQERESALQKANDESLVQAPKRFGPEYSYTEGPAGQIAPEYDENGKRSPLRDLYHASAVGVMLVDDAMAGLAGSAFGKESGAAKFYSGQADKAMGQSGISPTSSIGGINILETLRGTAQMAGDMPLLVGSGAAVRQGVFGLLQKATPAVGALGARALGSVPGHAVMGAATGALYSIPQDPATAVENVKMFAAFEAMAALGHAAAQGAKFQYDMMTKHVVKVTGAPKVVYFTPGKIRNVAGASADPMGGMTAEEYALYHDLGLKPADIKRAVREGISIELPTEYALKVADKPYWAKVKDAFGIAPYERTMDAGMSEMSWWFGRGKSMKPTPNPDAPLDLTSPVPSTPRELPPGSARNSRPSAGPVPPSAGPAPSEPIVMGPPPVEDPVEPTAGVPNGEISVPEVPRGGVEIPAQGPAGVGEGLGPVPGAQPPVAAPQVEVVGQGPGPEGQPAPEVRPGGGQPAGPGRVDVPVQAGGSEPAGQPAAEPGVSGEPSAPGTVRGRRRDVSAASGTGGENFPAHYELRELADLRASHNPLEQFRENPDYPAGIQDRPYATSQTHQEKVLERVAKFDPNQMVNTGPTAETGPSVVTRDGLVIGGNSRKMMLDIITSKHPDRYQKYLDTLREEAASFGLTPEQIGSLKQPVLVRALDFDSSEKDVRELGRISGVLNKPSMTGKDKISGGVAAAKGLTKPTLATFASGLSGYDTLRAYLDSPHASSKLVPAMEKDGVLDTQNRDQYMLDGKVTPEGKDLIEAAVRGFVVPNNELLQQFRRANAEELKTFDFALPHLAFAKAMGEEWVSGVMADTIKLFLDFNAAKVSWQKKNKGDARKYTPEFYLAQPTMLADIMDLRQNKFVREQFRALVTFKPREFAAAWKGYADALRELLERPTMPGITIDTNGIRKIVSDVMGDYDATQERAPKSYKDFKASEEVQADSVSEKPESETQKPEHPSDETQPEVKENDAPLPKAEAKEEETVLDLTEEDKREPWEMTLREFAGAKPSPPQIVGGKTVGGEGLKEWNAKAKEYGQAVAQAFRDGKLTLAEVRVKAPEQWLKLKAESEAKDVVKPPVSEPKEPGVVKPPTEPKSPKPVVSETPASPEVFTRAGLVVEQKTTDGGKTFWAVTGNTFAHKTDILSVGGRWHGKFKEWRIGSQEDLNELAKKLEATVPAGETPPSVGGRGAGGVIGVQIKALRDKLDSMPSTAPVQPEKSVTDATRGLIRAGEGAIPKEVLDAQIQDIGKIAAAYRRQRKAFVLASDPGMGKTFVLAGALKEIARGHTGPMLWVTQNRRLIEQIKQDIAGFNLGDKLHFLTYADLTAAQNGKKPLGVPVAGAVIAWDEGHSVKNTSASGQEAGAARADQGQKMMTNAKFNILASATPFENPTQMGYLSATGVFEPIKEMTGLGRAITENEFVDFAVAYGAGMRRIKMRGAPEKLVLEWERGTTPQERQTQNANAIAARNWLENQGMLAQREMRLQPGMVKTELKGVVAKDEQVEIIDRFADAMASAIEASGDQRALRRNLAGYMTNTLKRLMEDAKVEAAIAEARHAVDQGKQAVIFVETRADKEISGKDYPAMLEQMTEWQAEQQMMGDAGKPPYSRFQMAVAEALHTAGLDEVLPSTVARIKDGLGERDVAVFTGDRTENAANADLDLWLDNKKPVLVATMAKGGTGLSLHSRRPGDPERVLIGLNMPWTATTMKQVLGRVTRLGMLKPSEVRWLFLEHDFERTIAAKVGGRMQDMGAVVSGKVPQMGQHIEAFDFDAPVEGVAMEGLVDAFNDVPAGEAVTPEPAAEPVQQPQGDVVAETTPAEAMRSDEMLTLLAKDGHQYSGRSRVDMARAFADGVANDKPGFDMEPNPFGGLTYTKEVDGGVVMFHEIDGRLEFAADTTLSASSARPAARKPKEAALGVKRGKVTTDPRLIKSILFKDILNQNPSLTVVSELFQNSIDAFIDQAKKTGAWPADPRITVGLDAYSEGMYLYISDNGVGMTPDEVHKHYLAIGAKGKEGSSNVGGYGMAKVSFLFYPDRVRMRTTKDGVTTIIDASRDEFMDGSFPVESREALPGESGTEYLASLPTGKSEEGAPFADSWDFRSAVSQYVENSHVEGLTIERFEYGDDAVFVPADERPKGIPEDRSSSFNYKTLTKNPTFEKMPKVTPSKTVKVGKNIFEVHFLATDQPIPKTFGGNYYFKVQVYSKGMPLPALARDQFSSIDGLELKALETGETKFRVAVNLLESYRPEEARYPFLKNRTVLRDEEGKALSDVINDYVVKLNNSATDERIASFREMIDGAPIMGGVPILIPREHYKDVPAVRSAIERHEKMFTAYGKLIALWKATLDSAKQAGDARYMVTLDPTVYGWHAPDGLSGQGKIIALNPFTMLTKGELGTTPIMETDQYKALVEAGETRERILASAFTHTALHERVHDTVRGHSESFTSELGRLATLIGHLRMAALETKAQRFYKEFTDEIQDVADSLGRIREGGDAASGGPGPDVDASRVSPGGVVAVDRAAGRGEAPERARPVAPRRVKELHENEERLGEAFVFAGVKDAIAMPREDIGKDVSYDPVLGTFLFDGKADGSKDMVIRAVRGIEKRAPMEEWREFEFVDMNGVKVKAGKAADALSNEVNELRKLEDCLG